MHREKGFTILEVVVVVLVISAIAAVVLPFVQDGRENLEAARIAQTIDVLRDASKRFHLDTGKWPFEDSHANSATQHNLISDPGISGWKGPYISELVTQGPWERVIVHEGFSLGGVLVSPGYSQNGKNLSGTGCSVVFLGVTEETARALNDAIDHDAEDGGSSWKNGGLIVYKEQSLLSQGFGGVGMGVNGQTVQGGPGGFGGGGGPDLMGFDRVGANLVHKR